MNRAAAALAGWSALLNGPAMAADACPVQPVPALLEAVSSVASSYVTSEVSFSAFPNLEHPATGWVVRAYSEIAFEGPERDRAHAREVLEVIRLQVEDDCNRWFVTGRWQGPLEPGRVAQIIDQSKPFLAPAAAALSGKPGNLASQDSLILDGTGIEVETGGPDWRLRRGGHAHDETGGAVSRMFLSLATRLVPADELPTAEWRARAGQERESGGG